MELGMYEGCLLCPLYPLLIRALSHLTISVSCEHQKP